MYPDLYLMRHGQTEWNSAGRLQGRMDSALTAKGRAQAARQGELIAGVHAARWSSPQGRAVATAQIIFGDQTFATDERLVEIDVGDFTGGVFNDLRAQHPAIFAPPRLSWYDRAPGGEGFDLLRQRSQSFLDQLTAPALIVTHGITLRMLRLLAMGRTLDRIEDMRIEQGAVHVIRNAQHSIWR